MQMWNRRVDWCACVVSGQSGEILKKVKEHTKQINDIQTSVDLTMFITASKDNSAKVRPVYSAGPLAQPEPDSLPVDGRICCIKR